MQILDEVLSRLESVVNLITLGSYYDLLSFLSTSEPVPLAVIFAILLTVIKWVLLVVALFIFWRFICSRLRLSSIVIVVLTIACLVLVLVFYNNPLNDFNSIQSSVSGFIQSMNSTRVNYTPSIMFFVSYIETPINYTSNLLKFASNLTPDNVSIPVLHSGERLSSISLIRVDVSWLSWLVYVIVIVLSIFFLSKLNRLLALVVAFLIFCLAIGLSNTVVACIIVIIVCLALILVFWKKLKIAVVYPLSIMILILAYLFQPSQSILILMLVIVLVITLLPVFYIFGYIVYAVGEIVEGREKFGLKIKPKKVIEEVHGRWDVNAVALVLTLLFVITIMLFGFTISGIGTFLSITFGLLRR